MTDAPGPGGPDDGTFDDHAVHVWFGLTYASYLVLPRSHIRAMPDGWQESLAQLLDEMDRAAAEAGWERPDGGWAARPCDRSGRFAAEPGGPAGGYLVVPRTWMQSMPGRWQRALVGLLEEHHDAVLSGRLAGQPGRYHVNAVGANGRRVDDPVPRYNRGRTRLPLPPAADLVPSRP